MVKLGKLTDYGLVLMTCIAEGRVFPAHGADLAAESHLPLSTVSKLLKELLQSGLLVSQRGVKGGYVLARPPRQISRGSRLSRRWKARWRSPSAARTFQGIVRSRVFLPDHEQSADHQSGRARRAWRGSLFPICFSLCN